MINENCGDFKYKYGKFVMMTAALALVFWLGVDAINKIKGADSQQTTISFSGSGEVFAKPDLAITTFSVLTEAKTVNEALAENSRKMNAIIGFVKNQGVQEKDIKTTNFSISPRYEYQKVEMEMYPYPPGKRVLVGYDVSQSSEVKIRDLAKIGDLIQGAAVAGANQVGDLRFTIDNEDEFKKQAREQAITEAKNKAKELSKQLGIKLVKIVNFSEGYSTPIPYFSQAVEKAMPAPAPQIQAGENKIEANVTITYEIR